MPIVPQELLLVVVVLLLMYPPNLLASAKARALEINEKLLTHPKHCIQGQTHLQWRHMV
jgi:hypothetical protein